LTNYNSKSTKVNRPIGINNNLLEYGKPTVAINPTFSLSPSPVLFK